MNGWLIAALAAGGVGVLYVLKKQQEQAQAKSACQELCGSDAACAAACGVAGLGLDALGGLLHEGRPNSQVLSDEAKENDALNGAIKTPLSKLDPSTMNLKDPNQNGPDVIEALPFGLGGNALEYENGCVPFWGAVGWEKCAKGTHDMFGEEHRLEGEQVDMTQKWRFVDAQAAGKTADSPRGPRVRMTDQHAIRQGSIDPKQPDPTTQGPVKNADGSASWLVAGMPLQCPPNHAPALFDANHFDWPPRCVPVATTTGLQGTGTRTANTGDCAAMIAAGFTWRDATATRAGGWQRPRVGETPKCPPAPAAPTHYQLAAGALQQAFP